MCLKNVNQFMNKYNKVRKSSNQNHFITSINEKSIGEKIIKDFLKIKNFILIKEVL